MTLFQNIIKFSSYITIFFSEWTLMKRHTTPGQIRNVFSAGFRDRQVEETCFQKYVQDSFLAPTTTHSRQPCMHSISSATAEEESSLRRSRKDVCDCDLFMCFCCSDHVLPEKQSLVFSRPCLQRHRSNAECSRPGKSSRIHVSACLYMSVNATPLHVSLRI